MAFSQNEIIDTAMYMRIKSRIKELEQQVDALEREIPCKKIRDRLEATRLTLKANTEMVMFLYGEASLRQ